MEDMLIVLPARKRVWTLQDVLEAAEKRRHEEWVAAMLAPLPVTYEIVDDSTVEEVAPRRWQDVLEDIIRSQYPERDEDFIL